jgi:hypothetical protein
LLEFAHTEDELPRHDLVAEGFTDLGDAERYFLAGGFLNVQEIDKNTLRRFRRRYSLPSSPVFDIWVENIRLN